MGGTLIRLDPRRTPRLHATDRAMDLQVAARELRREGAELWAAARESNDYGLLSEARALAGLLRAVEASARRCAGIAEGLEECSGGLWSGRTNGHAA